MSSGFVEFARSCGLVLNYAIADGRWKRTPTEDRMRSRNGAYIFDGHHGVVRNFRTMDSFASYRDGAIERVNRADMQARIREAKIEEAQRHAAAAREAADLIFYSRMEKHPYLACKGFPDELGLVNDGALLVPMRDFNDHALWSVQKIAEDGTKRFLTGGRAKGMTMTIGPRYVSERWLCEGYATGLSIRAALRDMRRDAQVIICFSADNLRHVAPMVRKPAFVFADNDSSGAGERAAIATGLSWVMPPDIDTDANDMHAAHGLRAVVRRMQTILG